MNARSGKFRGRRRRLPPLQGVFQRLLHGTHSHAEREELEASRMQLERGVFAWQR